MKAEEFYKKRSNSIRELWALSPKQIEYITLIMEEYAALRQPPVMQRSELLAFKKFISKTPQTELEYYSDEEFTDLYLTDKNNRSMKKKEALFDILLKVSESWMDIETAEKKILQLFNVRNSLDLRELERKLDEALGKETRETLTEWLKQQIQ